jgi:hypothetical protein
MSVKLPSTPGVIEDRLASLEDPILAEQLFLEHPTLYGEEPPQTQRAVLAWTTRRFGTAALAVTAAVSVAAGYFLTPLVTHRSAPAQPAPLAKTSLPAPSRPVAHRHIVKQAAPARVAHRSALVPAAPVHLHVAPAHPIVHRATIVHAPVVFRHPSRETIALRAKVKAQEAEIAALNKRAAVEEAAARAAHARASAAAHQGSATRTAPAPLPQPRTQPAAEVYAPANSADPSRTAAAPVPVDAPLPSGGTKQPPPAPNGGWSERPPIPIYGSAPAPVPIGGTVDPCTPQGGRLGIIIHSLLGGRIGGGSLHLQL